MFKLNVVETYRAESREEAEAFIKAQREAGVSEGYDVTKASYTHKEKKSKGSVVDACEVVSITKVYATVWGEE